MGRRSPGRPPPYRTADQGGIGYNRGMSIPVWLTTDDLDWALFSWMPVLTAIGMATMPARTPRTRRLIRRFTFLRWPVVWIGSTYLAGTISLYALAFVSDTVRYFNTPRILAAVTTAGLALFLLRRWNQLLYGLLEGGAAASAAVGASSAHQATPLERGLALAAAVYFIVRALVNIQDGWRSGCWPRPWIDRRLCVPAHDDVPPTG